ncbi:E3 ubiquitin-protein ligase TRIM36-like [Antedon mediterranea]|uniref:E3 ubiquitin-protein ligase TRIM36-like n=1 Tax=Antedon mediterranea TaxID=105859 RepID=UPI003AF8F57D
MMENLEKELICPICDDYFTTPIVLPCHHNICHKCARECLSSLGRLSNAGSVESVYSVSGGSPPLSPNSPPKTSISSNVSPRSSNGQTSPSMQRKSISRTGSLRRRSGSFRRQSSIATSESEVGGAVTKGLRRRESFGGRSPRPPLSASSRSSTPRVKNFPCPSCKSDVDLGDKGINGLFRNFTLEAIVERYKLAAKKAASIPCGSCRTRPPEDATKSCLDCRASYCNVCYKNVHPWGTPRAQHMHVGPTRNYRPKTITCPEHPDERVTMYCEGCQKPICHMCKFSGVHANHKVSGMERKYNVMKDKLEKNINKVQGRRDLIQAELDRIKAMRLRLETSGVMFKEHVKSALDSVSELLAMRQESLLERAETEVSTRIDVVQNMLEAYEKMLQDCNVIEYAQEILKETEHACFVQAARPVISRMHKMADTMKLKNIDVSDDFKNMSITSDKALEAVGDLNFLKIPGIPTMLPDESYAYKDVKLCWKEPSDGGKVDSYNLEYRMCIQHSPTKKGQKTKQTKVDTADQSERNNSTSWTGIQGITTSQHTICSLEYGQEYEFRVQAVNAAGCGTFCDAISLRTAPGSVFNFRFDATKINSGKDTVEISGNGMNATVFPNSSILDNVGLIPKTAVSLNPVYIIGDQKITSGRHYWEIVINQSAYVSQVGVVSEKKSRLVLHPGDQVSTDSGHDSCEEADVHEDPLGSDCGVMINHFMGKVRLPSPKTSTTKDTSAVTVSNTLGVLVDCDNSLVSLYDGKTKRVVFTSEGCIRGPVYPGLVIVGAGSFSIRC